MVSSGERAADSLHLRVPLHNRARARLCVCVCVCVSMNALVCAPVCACVRAFQVLGTITVQLRNMWVATGCPGVRAFAHGGAA